RPEQARHRRSCRERRLRLRRQEGRIRQGGRLPPQSGRRRSRQDCHQPHGPFIYSVDETLDVGEDRGTPILEDYADRMPFKYAGWIDEVDIDLMGGNAAAEVPDIDGK